MQAQPLRRILYKALQKQDVACTRLAIQAMKWRRFSTQPIHPKHLFDPARASLLHQVMQPGITFLDIGSGMGSECLAAARKGAARSVGIEGNPENIAKSEKRAEEECLKIEIAKLDIETARFPFADATFDLVNFTNVLEHLNNRQAVLKEIKRVKKPDARVLISIPNSETSWKKKLRAVGLDSRDDDDHKIEYSKTSLHQEMKDAGLEIVSELHPIIPSFPWNGALALSAAVSPSLYKSLQDWKMSYTKQHPEESMGWMFFAR